MLPVRCAARAPTGMPPSAAFIGGFPPGSPPRTLALTSFVAAPSAVLPHHPRPNFVQLRRRHPRPHRLLHRLDHFSDHHARRAQPSVPWHRLWTQASLQDQFSPLAYLVGWPPRAEKHH